MKYQSKKTLDAMVEEMKEAAKGGMKTWDPYQKNCLYTKAILLIPLGELMNPNIDGYVWAWHMEGKITTCPVPDNVRLNAHGLEGCFTVTTTLVTALTVYDQLPEFRCAVAI